MNVKQFFCNHWWDREKDSQPSYYCSVFSVFAKPGSILDETYLVRWWLQCKKCKRKHLLEWFVNGDNEGKELCPHCRLYVSVKSGYETIYERGGETFVDGGLPIKISYCHNCGCKTSNLERENENWRDLVSAASDSKRVRGRKN